MSSFGHCRTRRLRLHPQTRRGAGRPSHRRPARPVRSGSAAHCMRPPAKRHARQPAGNLPGRHPRGTPAHTGNRPMRPSRRRHRRTPPDRRAQRRVQPWPRPGQASSQLPGRLRPCAHGDSHAFVSSRTPLRLPGQASRIVRGLSSPSLSIRARAVFPCTGFEIFFGAAKKKRGEPKTMAFTPSQGASSFAQQTDAGSTTGTRPQPRDRGVDCFLVSQLTAQESSSRRARATFPGTFGCRARPYGERSH